MRVSRLEVFGFKSFMNRLMLPLEGGISGVVGPNGCGKSNIVDALRWVLGETRASNLRGALLEDVIFNGTDKFRPLGLAEVSISLRSRGDNFFSDLLTPLEVLRLETNGLDSVVQDLGVKNLDDQNSAGETDANNLKATGSPRAEGHNSIGLKVIEGFKGKEMPVDASDANQAHAGRAGSESPEAEEENGVEDEAREEDNVDAIQDTVSPAILNRFAWLKATSEVQITRRLYRSGESEFFLNRVQCKLKDIKDLLRAVGLGPRSYTIVAQGEVGRIVSSKPEERRAIIEEAAGVLGIKERISSAKRRLEETRGNLTRLDDVISEVTRQVSSLKRQAARAEARADLKSRLTYLDHVLLVERLTRFDAEIKRLNTHYAELQTKERTLSEQLTTRRLEEENARAELTTVEAQGDALRLEVDQIKEEIHRKKRLLFEQESRVNELRGAVAMKREEAGTNQERAEGLRARKVQLEQERVEAQREFDLVSAEAASLEKGNDEELRASNLALQSAREVLRSSEGKLRTARENLLRSQTRLSEVEKHIVASSPMTQIQRTLGDKSPLTENLKRTSRPLSDALRVPAHLTTAVRAVLGERAGFLVAENPFDVARIAEEGDLTARRNGFCLGVMRSGESSAQFSAGQLITNSETTGLAPLLSLVIVEPWAQCAANDLLGNVLVADSVKQATEFFANARDEQGLPLRRTETVVTRKGEMFTADSFFIFNHEGGVLELKVSHERLRSELHALEIEASKCSGERDAAATAVEAAERRNAQALTESQARQTAFRALLNRQGNARGRLDATERMLRQTHGDAERADAAVKNCTAKIGECEQALELVLTKIAELKAADTTESEARLALLTNDYKALDVKRAALRSAVSSAANVTAELQRNGDFVRREIARSELEEQKVALERQHVVQNFIQLYGQDSFNAVTASPVSGSVGNDSAGNESAGNESALTPENKIEFEKESETIRSRIMREGDVDPSTIEQYRVENERLQELINQHTDLSSAVATLAATVLSLEQASVERFVSTFNAVARHFELLIPRLFGGGKGELVLTSPETPLHAGVEILVRPPGKKPKSIELLSGGEKALCATAMIFAMFLVRPSPLCVLDEVDAPLDEANLVRLLTLIKEMSHKTQFLMITHNKQSMAMADNLVGVTMQDPGSTQILTVSLQEAVGHAV